MQSNVKVIAVLVAPLCLSALLCSCNQEPKQHEDGEQAAAKTASNPEAAPGRPVEGAVLSGPANRRRRPGTLDLAAAEERGRSEELLKSYQCKTDHCVSEALGASSPAEAAWLQSRGFPTPAREAELEAMSLGELQLAADKSDLAAEAVLGRKMMEQGNRLGGLTRLAGAAAAGNVYADYQLSRGERNSNIVESAAYLRRAYLQGDSKAAMVMYQTFPKFSAVEWLATDNRAMQLYSSLLAQRVNKGQMRYGPRPQ